VGPVDMVEAHFDETGLRRAVARAPKLPHRLADDRYADERLGHQRKKPPQQGLRRLPEILSCRRRLADSLLNRRVMPPIGRKRASTTGERRAEKTDRQNGGDNSR